MRTAGIQDLQFGASSLRMTLQNETTFRCTLSCYCVFVALDNTLWPHLFLIFVRNNYVHRVIATLTLVIGFVHWMQLRSHETDCGLR
jgi:hypothetical protein